MAMSETQEARPERGDRVGPKQLLQRQAEELRMRAAHYDALARALPEEMSDMAECALNSFIIGELP